MLANCPGCGAQVLFRGETSVFAVCSYCQSTLLRSGVTVEMIGKMAIVDDDWSPLQINTLGIYLGINFVVIGRVRLRWSDGSWNEWYISLDDGRTGWLTEAQGFYGLTFPISEKVPDLDSISVGTEIKLGKNILTVQDIKKAECDFSQGELPFKAVIGRKSTTVDLGGQSNNFGSIEYGPEGSSAFLGTYEPFKELKFTNLRAVDGW